MAAGAVLLERQVREGVGLAVVLRQQQPAALVEVGQAAPGGLPRARHLHRLEEVCQGVAQIPGRQPPRPLFSGRAGVSLVGEPVEDRTQVIAA